MAYTYRPPGVPLDHEDDPLLPPKQPAATVPDPANDGDPYRRNSTAVDGNIETRYGAVVPPVGQPPTRAATPDAFAPTSAAVVASRLLVPSTAPAEVGPPSAVQPVTTPTAAPAPVLPSPVASAPALAPAAPAPVPTNPLVQPGPTAAAQPTTPTPIPGTLPGAIPQPNGLPATPRPLLPEEEDAYRQRRVAGV